MVYTSLRDCVNHLESLGELRRIDAEVNPHLEMAEIQRRVYAAGGPALMFNQVKGSAFPCVSNLFGTKKRTWTLLGEGVERAQKLIQLRNDPMRAIRHPLQTLSAGWNARLLLPRKEKAAANNAIHILDLPQITSWPKDGGAFITLPQVYTENPDKPGIWQSNVGMYRIQLSGNEYLINREVGMHYQIHRGIGVHHHAAIARGEKLKVTLFIGGPPAHILAAILPLPENLAEIMMAGLLGGHAFRYARQGGHLLSSEADFCITGTIDPTRTLSEGPFGDHLGYYSLQHHFPVLSVENVFHRPDAIWPFTVVGRPPQEDSHLAEMIHAIAGDALAQEIPGLKAVHAVEAAGVHPLLLALAEDRYVPFAEKKARELHTIGFSLMGYGQLSLAKYVWLADYRDNPHLNIRDVRGFINHVLFRVNWETDMHFQTQTTMDTLDYSGTKLHEGSKLLLTISGSVRRNLGSELSAQIRKNWPEYWTEPKVVMPGVFVFSDKRVGENFSETLETSLTIFSEKIRESGMTEVFSEFPLWVLVDDASFTAQSFDNFLWVTFTRSDPARDVQGIFAFTENKHWGCRGPLVIDARIKPHHAPTVEPDPVTVKKVEAMAAPGQPLHGLL